MSLGPTLIMAVRRYLAAHDFFPEDKVVEGQVRLILHRSMERSAVWRFVPHPRLGGRILQLQRSLGASGVPLQGQYLRLQRNPPRDATSLYLSVSASVGDALLLSTPGEV